VYVHPARPKEPHVPEKSYPKKTAAPRRSRPTGGGAIHCFCFAVAVKGAPPIDYTSHD